MWVGLKETVRVRVISVRVWDHILPDMLEHQGLPGVLLACLLYTSDAADE